MRKLKNEELKRKTVVDFKEATKTPLILILDNIRSLKLFKSVNFVEVGVKKDWVMFDGKFKNEVLLQLRCI